MRRVRTVGTVAGLLVTAAFGRAIGQGPVLPLPGSDQRALSTYLGPGVVGQALPCQPITDPTTIFPLQARSWTFQVTSGAKTGNTQVLGLNQAPRPSGQPAWRLGLSPVLAGFINQDQSGNLLMPALSDSAQGLVIVSTPPNPFLLTNVQPGESRQLTQKVAANYLDNPSSTDYSGTLNCTFTYVGTYQVTVPAGTFPAVLTRVVSKGKVGPAQVEDINWAFFAPGVGPVAIVTQEEISAFWIYNVDTRTGKVMVTQ